MPAPARHADYAPLTQQGSGAGGTPMGCGRGRRLSGTAVGLVQPPAKLVGWLTGWPGALRGLRTSVALIDWATGQPRLSQDLRTAGRLEEVGSFSQTAELIRDLAPKDPFGVLLLLCLQQLEGCHERLWSPSYLTVACPWL